MDDITRRRARCKTLRTQPGVSYFLTFPLADALPRAVREAWHEETESRMRILSQVRRRPLTLDEELDIAAKTRGRVENYLDRGHGSCLFATPKLATVLKESLFSFSGERYDLLAWCVMPNHLHCVLTPIHGAEIDAIVKALSWRCTQEANRLTQRVGSLWKTAPYMQILREEASVRHMVRYVADNPARAGLLDWPYSGAKGDEDLLVTATRVAVR